MMGNLTAMTADHVNKNSGHSWLQEGSEGAQGGPRGAGHAESATMSSLYRRLYELAGFNSVIRSIYADCKIVKTMDTIKEPLSKLYKNNVNKIHKFIFFKTISQHREILTQLNCCPCVVYVI
jgi:hypothetical protein